MSEDNWDSQDLIRVAVDGQINEDVMQRVWDISKIPLPLTQRIGSGESGNEYKSWTTDKLADANPNNAAVDGENFASTVNDAGAGERIGNHHQIATKIVRVSTRARNSDTIGRADELAYQVMMRQQECRRDVEASICSDNASVESDPDASAVAGVSAGFFAFIRDAGQTIPGNAILASGAAATAPGFAAGIVAAATTTAAVGLTEDAVRNASQLAYDDGGNPSILMGTTTMVRAFSEYLFTSSARIAALYSDTGQKDGAVTAKGSVNMFVTDFGISLELMANRLQPQSMTDQVANAGESHMGIIDPNYLEISYLHGYRVEPLAKNGLADNRLMCVDYTLCVKSLDAHATLLNCDEAVAVAAS
jgi:hypothetical protein